MAENVVTLMEKSEDKKKALEAALSQIEKNYGKGSVMKLGDPENVVEIEAISTGSLGLDIALGIGGLPRGRIIEIYGPESSGKTTLALHTVAEAQKMAGFAALLMPNMRLTRPMPENSACKLRICLSRSPIMANRRWKLPIRWCAPVRWMCWSLTRLPR